LQCFLKIANYYYFFYEYINKRGFSAILRRNCVLIKFKKKYFFSIFKKQDRAAVAQMIRTRLLHAHQNANPRLHRHFRRPPLPNHHHQRLNP
jgi:hypothetical protein